MLVCKAVLSGIHQHFFTCKVFPAKYNFEILAVFETKDVLLIYSCTNVKKQT